MSFGAAEDVEWRAGKRGLQDATRLQRGLPLEKDVGRCRTAAIPITSGHVGGIESRIHVEVESQRMTSECGGTSRMGKCHVCLKGSHIPEES